LSKESNNKIDPLDVLRDTASLFRRKAEMYRALHAGCNGNGGDEWRVRCDIYQHESDRLDDLTSLCDGTATKNSSADTLPVAAETAASTFSQSFPVEPATIDGNADTLPLMPRSGLTPQP
jgi:hypothetical protein